GAIFFYFLGILSDRYKLDFFIEFLFQSLIIAAVVFLGLKIFFIRNFHGGFYYFSEIKSLFFSFFWFFVNINALKIIAKKGEFFLSIGLCINLTLMIMIFVQNMGIELFMMSMVIALIYLWVLVFVVFYRKKSFNSSIFYFLSFLTVSLSVLGTAKSILIFSLIVPALILGIPFLFLLIMTIMSFIRFSKGKKTTFFWSFSYNRLIFFVFLAAFYVNMLVLLIFSEMTRVYIGILIFVSFILLYYAGFKIFFKKGKSVKKNKIFGVDIKPVSNQKVIKRTMEMLNGEWSNFIVTLNSLMLYEAKHDDFYKTIMNSADMQIIDGAGVLWALDFLGIENAEKLSGIDYMGLLLKLASKNNKKIYFLGTRQEILDKTIKKVISEYGESIVAGSHNGYFDEDGKERILNDINSSGAHILLVGMGIPKQEKWIFYNLHKMHNIKIAMGIGGAFDVLSGELKRAPLWMQNWGLEWLFRVIMEPSRFSRILKLPAFVLNVMNEKIK
ncbi:MAG: WecB/TagA/CpsF family glycosyltransferase, partial [Candidatus Muiribacteriota bacterium]